jgi:hypothetical protein
MSSVQQNVLTYAQAIQNQLAATVSPVNVYANFNRNFAEQQQFLVWQLRNVHQPVYTGQDQTNKGIDTPIFQVNVFASDMNNCFNMTNQILQALHGYSGTFGANGSFAGIWVAKIDITMLYNTYDDQVKLNQIVLDCRMDIPC